MTKLVKPPLELKKRQLSKKQEKLPNWKLGAFGETQAILFLQKKRFKILNHNVRLRNREIDIIALDVSQDEIAFIEVKTRKSEKNGHPSLAVNQKKIAAMNTVAQYWLKKHNLAKDYRFDIISVLINRRGPEKIDIEHLENVTLLGI